MPNDSFAISFSDACWRTAFRFIRQSSLQIGLPLQQWTQGLALRALAQRRRRVVAKGRGQIQRRHGGGDHGARLDAGSTCDESDSQQAFVRDFVAAWDKVMNLDRFDLA